MERRAKLFGHAIHQLLIAFPAVGVDPGGHVDARRSLRLRRAA